MRTYYLKHQIPLNKIYQQNTFFGLNHELRTGGANFIVGVVACIIVESVIFFFIPSFMYDTPTTLLFLSRMLCDQQVTTWKRRWRSAGCCVSTSVSSAISLAWQTNFEFQLCRLHNTPSSQLYQLLLNATITVEAFEQSPSSKYVALISALKEGGGYF